MRLFLTRDIALPFELLGERQRKLELKNAAPSQIKSPDIGANKCSSLTIAETYHATVFFSIRLNVIYIFY